MCVQFAENEKREKVDSGIQKERIPQFINFFNLPVRGAVLMIPFCEKYLLSKIKALSNFQLLFAMILNG